MNDTATPEEPTAETGDLAPAPRPGYRTPRAAPGGISTTQMAALFAGVLRACLGLLGFFAALLYLPVHQATPILAGVSVLLVVTGNVSVFRAIDGSAGVRRLFKGFAAMSLLVLLASTALVIVLGAGAFRPRPPVTQQQDEGPPTVRFQMDP